MDLESSPVTPIQPLTPAPLGRRLINHIVDQLLATFLAATASILFLLATAIYKTNISKTTQTIIIFVVYVAFRFLYFFIGERYTGRTLAKYLTKTQVISQSGRLRTSQIAGRTLARLLPFEEISILFGKNTAWHDSVSHTLVVKSSDLPSDLRPGKRRDLILTVMTCLLLLLPLGLVVALPLYEKATGGERLRLPKTMPSDLRLTNISEEKYNDLRYYSLFYTGSGRTVSINRLIAGYNFDPDEPCIGMLPKKDEFSYGISKPKDTENTCIEIYRKPATAIRVFSQTPHTGAHSLASKLPEFYITDPPYRLVIKVETGRLSQEEVIKMAESGLQTYTAKDLKAAINAQ